MAHTYFPSWSANNYSSYSRGYINFESKTEAIKWAKACIRGNHYKQVGNKSTYRVYNENGRVVAEGAYLGLGRWVIYHEAIEA